MLVAPCASSTDGAPCRRHHIDALLAGQGELLEGRGRDGGSNGGNGYGRRWVTQRWKGLSVVEGNCGTEVDWAKAEHERHAGEGGPSCRRGNRRV